jgi:hypothetical protein
MREIAPHKNLSTEELHERTIHQLKRHQRFAPLSAPHLHPPPVSAPNTLRPVLTVSQRLLSPPPSPQDSQHSVPLSHQQLPLPTPPFPGRRPHPSPPRRRHGLYLQPDPPYSPRYRARTPSRRGTGYHQLRRPSPPAGQPTLPRAPPQVTQTCLGSLPAPRSTTPRSPHDCPEHSRRERRHPFRRIRGPAMC